jgi:transketolase
MRNAALDEIANLVAENESIVFVGSDLGAGTLDAARKLNPKRILIEGIAEQHIVGFAAGLALEKFIPYVHTISTFLTRRALEQIIVDVALHELPVRLLGAGGGMVYAPLGPTHQSIDDFALMSAIHSMMICAPADPSEMRSIIRALSTHPGPAYIRVGKGGEPDVTSGLIPMDLFKWRLVEEGAKVALITTGTMLHACIEAVQLARKSGLNPTLLHVPIIRPIPEEFVKKLSETYSVFIVVEEHQPFGGLATAIAGVLMSQRQGVRIIHIALPGRYSHSYGNQQNHLYDAGLNATSISKQIENAYEAI